MNGSTSTGNEYTYDTNGNLVQDYNKKIAKIQYNLLNLPSMLQFQNGNTTSYLYSNDGVKRKVTHQSAIANVVIPMGSIQPLSSGQIAYTSTTNYCGNVIYEDGILSKILTDKGYITLSGSTPSYHYNLKDRLGNNRVVMAQSGTVEQINQYYPFSGLFGQGTATSNQAYKYNGKELDRMHGLDWYDYGARNYDAALPVWTTIDPHAENYYSWSPYHYAANNPILMIDPDARDWYQSTNKDGAVMWQKGSADIDGYNNIGANYTQNIGGGTSVTYTQNEATSMTFTGIEESNFVAQGTGTGCKIASDQMLANEGMNSGGERINVVNSDANGVATTATANATRGINAVDKALENGKPIEVGVDYKSKQVNNLKPNGDGMTGHYLRGTASSIPYIVATVRRSK